VHYSGDEDWCGKEMYVALEELNKRGAKYHVHLQPIEENRFTIDKQQFEELQSLGLNLSLHFDFITNNKFRYNKEDLEKQVNLYKEKFGKLPTTSNTHWLIYNGFGETSRWYSELGIKSSIRQIGISTDLFDINKMNDFGFSFGTSYPTRTVDVEKEATLIDVDNLKITFYEPRIVTPEDEQRIVNYINLCQEFALFSNIFIHPTYFVLEKDTVLSAVDKIMALEKEKNIKMMYTDEVAKWWRDRRECAVESVSANELRVDLKVPAVLKFLTETTLQIGQTKYNTVNKKIAGRDVWLVELPAGQYTITKN
jgi:hypothetical protein